jgi:hypothetical protein
MARFCSFSNLRHTVPMNPCLCARCKQLHEFPGLPIEIHVFCRSVPVSAAEQFPFTVQREFCQETPVLQRQSDHDANAITGNKDKIPDFSKQ